MSKLKGLKKKLAILRNSEYAFRVSLFILSKYVQSEIIKCLLIISKHLQDLEFPFLFRIPLKGYSYSKEKPEDFFLKKHFTFSKKGV